jgi:hypothetical protein
MQDTSTHVTPKNSHTHSRLLAICRLIGKSFYVHFHKLLPWQIGYLQSHHLPMESSPFSLLRECLSDMYTALHRMGQRVDRLPYFCTFPVGPCFEQAPNGSWVPNTRTHACMADMQHLENDHPASTGFDWEMFRIGWEAGARWGEAHRCETEREENTYYSPIE